MVTIGNHIHRVIDASLLSTESTVIGSIRAAIKIHFIL